jgi:hypothetical protein
MSAKYSATTRYSENRHDFESAEIIFPPAHNFLELLLLPFVKVWRASASARGAQFFAPKLDSARRLIQPKGQIRASGRASALADPDPGPCRA